VASLLDKEARFFQHSAVSNVSKEVQSQQSSSASTSPPITPEKPNEDIKPRIEVEETSQRELLWKQYALHYDLYKFHLESTIKAMVLMFAVNGAMLGYYINLPPTNDLRKFLLIPACAMNLMLGFGLLVAARGVPAREREVISIAKRLGFQSPPNLTLLQFFLFLFCSVVCLTAGALAYLILFKK
jgi:hypothetical protein